VSVTPLSSDSTLEAPAAAPVRPPRALLLAVAVAINMIWALSYPVSKLVMADLPVGALTCWRMAGAALLVAPFLRRHDMPARPKARDLGMLVMMGLVGFALPIVLQYMGTVRTTASNVSLIVGIETVVVVVMAAIALKEPIRGRTWGGLAAAVAGVGLISVDPTTLDLFSGRYATGNGLMLLSIMGFASYTIIGKPLTGRWSPMALTALPMVVGAVAVVPAYALLDPAGFARGLALSWQEGLGVFFITAIATALSYVAWNWILRWVSAGQLAYSLYVQPVAGALFSAWLLKEALTPLAAWGAALILVAMVLGTETSAPAPAPAEDEQPLAA
jgi:drug/metabolite transporter (DMT)-like permease